MYEIKAEKAIRKEIYKSLQDEVVGDIVVRKPYTMVQMVYQMPETGKIYVGYGFSKVAWPDQYSREEGIARAARRARRDVYKQIIADFKLAVEEAFPA